MKFCMLTTFFGTHSFGGDAAFVDRLSRALSRHGHEVHVIYCRDAFDFLYHEGATQPKMLSIGLHMRIIGHPARAAGRVNNP